MPSELFDPLLQITLTVAKRDTKAKPPVSVPARVVPMLTFTKVPEKAKDALLDVLDSDPEFRARVLERADERSVGRLGMAFLERPDGWQEFVDRMIGAAEEPVIEPTGDLRRIERKLEAAERAKERAEVELTESKRVATEATAALANLRGEVDRLQHSVRRLTEENGGLVEQRKRAVSELKTMEDLAARRIAERKSLEVQLASMTSAQLATTGEGGGVGDEAVRTAVDEVASTINDALERLGELRESATPRRVASAKRSKLPIPPGLFDDSIEVAEYLLGVPGIVVLVDGYNVTREAHDDWELDRQRDWLEQGLRNLAARTSASFDVVFDGADLPSHGRGGRDAGVRVRFSPAGVEADDVLIDSVSAVAADRPVVIVSSDRRVRTGASERGANVLHSRQLLAIMG